MLGTLLWFLASCISHLTSITAATSLPGVSAAACRTLPPEGSVPGASEVSIGPRICSPKLHRLSFAGHFCDLVEKLGEWTRRKDKTRARRSAPRSTRHDTTQFHHPFLSPCVPFPSILCSSGTRQGRARRGRLPRLGPAEQRPGPASTTPAQREASSRCDSLKTRHAKSLSKTEQDSTRLNKTELRSTLCLHTYISTHEPFVQPSIH